MILPDSKFRHLWDFAALIAAVYSALTIPLIITFNIFSELFCDISTWIITAVFPGDIFVRFSTANPGRGKLVLNRKQAP